MLPYAGGLFDQDNYHVRLLRAGLYALEEKRKRDEAEAEAEAKNKSRQ